MYLVKFTNIFELTNVFQLTNVYELTNAFKFVTCMPQATSAFCMQGEFNAQRSGEVKWSA